MDVNVNVLLQHLPFSKYINKKTRSSATAKSTAHPPCLVGVLYDISWEKICWSTNQPPLRNWPRKLPNSCDYSLLHVVYAA